MGGGGLLQLVAYGAQDVYLTGNPQITFFKVVYRRHTNFSMEAIKQDWCGGQDCQSATIARNGDMILRMYLEYVIAGGGPGKATLTEATDTEPAYKTITHQPVSCRIHNPTTTLIDEVSLQIGGQDIEKHTGNYMDIDACFMENNDAGIVAQAGKMNGTLFQNMSGHGGVASRDHFGFTRYFTPLRFWFCKNPGLALPLIALQYHEVKVKVTWNCDPTRIRSAPTVDNQGNPYDGNGPEVPKYYCPSLPDEFNAEDMVNHAIDYQKIINDVNSVGADGLTNAPAWNLEYGKKNCITSTLYSEIAASDEYSNRTRFLDAAVPYAYGAGKADGEWALNGSGIRKAAGCAASPAALWVDYVYLDVDERTRMASIAHEYLIKGTNSSDHPARGSTHNLANAAHPCLAIFITGPYNKVTGCRAPIDGTMNSTDLNQGGGVNSTLNLKLTLNGHDRMHQRNLAYFCRVQPWQHGPGTAPVQVSRPATDGQGNTYLANSTKYRDTPNSGTGNFGGFVMGVYSFALQYGEDQPTGTCNFSRIDNARIETTNDAKLSLYTVHFNVLRIVSGMGGLAYSN